MSHRRAASSLLVVAALLLVLIRVAGDRNAPPMYEGYRPQESYHYLHPTAKQRGSPIGASQTASVSSVAGGWSVQTDELPPQAMILVGDATLDAAPGAMSVTCTIRAVDPPAPAPANGEISGNVYRFVIVSNAGAAVALRNGHPATVVLRAPVGTTTATLERFDGVRWVALHTTPLAEPFIFAANTAVLGDFALVTPTRSSQSTDEFPWYLWLVAAAAIALALLMLLRPEVRRRRV